MITPEYLDQIIKAVEAQTAQLNMYLIKRMAKRIASAFNSMQDKLIIPSTINDFHKLLDAGMVYSDIEKAIEKELPGLRKEIRKAFMDSAEEIAQYSRRIEKEVFKAEGPDGPIPYSLTQSELATSKAAKAHNMTDEEVRALEEAYKRTNGTLYNYTKTTARQSQTDFINACDNAWMKVKSGVSIGTACTEAIDDLAKMGVHTVAYGGRTDTIETAVTRAVRTGINQANSEVVLRRCGELHTNYVKVSSHLGARVTKSNDYTNHSWWQGKIYHIDWNNPAMEGYKSEDTEPDDNPEGYPDFVESCGYGEIAGICGINCRHTFFMYYPEFQDGREDTFDSEENKKRYQEEQKARYMERGIRETKRRIEALKEYDSPEARDKIRELNIRLDNQSYKYLEFCKDSGVKPNNINLQIGKAGNAQSYEKNVQKSAKNVQKEQAGARTYNLDDDYGYDEFDTDFADERIENEPLNEQATYDFEIDTIPTKTKELIKEKIKAAVEEGHKVGVEFGYALDMDGNELLKEIGTPDSCMYPNFFTELEQIMAEKKLKEVILIHNHINNSYLSVYDVDTYLNKKYVFASFAGCNNGDVHYINGRTKNYSEKAVNNFYLPPGEKRIVFTDILLKSGLYDIIDIEKMSDKELELITHRYEVDRLLSTYVKRYQ